VNRTTALEPKTLAARAPTQTTTAARSELGHVAPPTVVRAAPVATTSATEAAPPSKKAKFARTSKEARAAKAAKKAAKKAARQAERKARAKNNNRAAIRATAAAQAGKAETLPASAARIDGRKAVAPSSDKARRAMPAQRATKNLSTEGRPAGGLRAISTTLLILVAAVGVLSALGWFLASRR
jgi:hypothetical protein